MNRKILCFLERLSLGLFKKIFKLQQNIRSAYDTDNLHIKNTACVFSLNITLTDSHIRTCWKVVTRVPA